MSSTEEQFYGGRNPGVAGPAGNRWWIATHKEDVSPEEMRKRAAAAGLRNSCGRVIRGPVEIWMLAGPTLSRRSRLPITVHFA